MCSAILGRCHSLFSSSKRLPFITGYQGTRKASRLTFKDIGNRGRLGNQLFQIASTIGIAESNGLEWMFPTSIINCTAGQLFRLSGEFERNDQSVKVIDYLELYETPYDIELPAHRVDRDIVISLGGYFQVYQYFEKSHNTLHDYLKVPLEMIRTVQSAVPEVMLTHSLTVHVRRGDYVGNFLYSDIGFDYYHSTLQHMRNISALIIVTDDKTWVKREMLPRFSKRGGGYKLIVSPFESVLHDFVLLMLGHHIIIANSSFSWWAAYFKKFHAGLRDGAVYAPYPWYNDSGRFAGLNRVSFYPSDWRLTRISG